VQGGSDPAKYSGESFLSKRRSAELKEQERGSREMARCEKGEI
jgi:hypothetical protein